MPDRQFTLLQQRVGEMPSATWLTLARRSLGRAKSADNQAVLARNSRHRKEEREREAREIALGTLQATIAVAELLERQEKIPDALAEGECTIQITLNRDLVDWRT